MKPILYRVLYAFTFLFWASQIEAQILLNEICPSNSAVIANDNGHYDDWIEVYNAGNTAINLSGYGLSDDVSSLHRFTFPDYTLGANSRMIVFCSGKNQTEIVDHWETVVKATDTWKYFVGTSNPDTNWRNNSFNDASWSSGVGGFGFGDGDDNTTITTCASVMIRKHFSISDTANIIKAIFNIDYDDAFVAYLNGVEIARANIGTIGDRPINSTLAYTAHEAVMYQGMSPDSFYIKPSLLKNILRIGDNVLAVEVHNTSVSNPDLSCIPFLTFGIKNNVHTWPNPPSWFLNNFPERFQADFKLSRSGETVYLSTAASVIIDQHTFTNMALDNSKGRLPDGGVNWCYFQNPTPGLTNNSSTCYAGYATIPLFSLQAGFYSGSQWLNITTTQQGGIVRYTTNGKDVEDTSPVFSGPLLVSTTQAIKAKVFATGYVSSATIANTYFINESVHYPVFTITTDPENLFNYNTGIYVFGPNADSVNVPYFGSNFWQDWEKPATIEFYDKDKNRVSRFDADIKIYGNYSRAKAQKSFEIKLSDKYGTGDLHYSFLQNKPWVDDVNDIVLRNAGSDNNMLHFRDHLMEQNLQGTNCDYIAQNEAVLFLNGQFWGIYQIAENDDHHFMKNNYGLSSDEIDLLKEGGNLEIKNGSDTGFYSLFNYAVSTPANDPAYYPTISSKLDMLNYADYFISETYYCNEDWIGDWTNNIKFWRPRETGGKWRYLNYDLDFGLFLESHADDNILGRAINPNIPCFTSNLFNTLLNNNQFRRYFINRYADLINTIFLPSHMLPQLTAIRDTMAFDIGRQFQRWGLTSLIWNTEYNKASTFINDRPGYARSYIKSEFNLVSQVTLTLNASPAGSGRIQISTITPTTLPWSGVYFNGNPVTITAIPNPGYTFDHWHSNVVIGTNDFNQSTTYNFTSTDQITAYFTGAPANPLITFSEINYHTDSIIRSEDWVELHNYGSTSVDISGWKFRDNQDNHVFEFPVNTVIAAGGYLVLAEDVAKFSLAYPSVTNVLGPFGHSFANNEEQLRLFDYRDSLYLSVVYSDQLPWPLEADGDGYTCELINPYGDLNDGNNWFAGCLYGSPGRAFSTITASISSGGNLSFCSPGSVSLSANSGSGYAYQWTANGSNLAGETTPSYIAVAGGWYAVLIDSSGCRAKDSVLVSALSVADPVTTSGINCGPGTVSVSATGGGVISWFDAPNANQLLIGNNYTSPVLFSSTTYYAVADSAGCRSNFMPVLASILQTTALPVTNDISRCGTGTVTLTASDTAIVHWYNASSGGILLQTGPTFTTPVLSSTTTYFVEAGTFCPSNRIAVNAIINNVSSPVTTDGSRCGQGTVNLGATASDPVDWYDQPSGGNFMGSGFSLTTPVISTTTIYYAEANNGCASVRMPATATVNPVSLPPQVMSSFSCGQGNVTLTATSSDPISWYDAPVAGNYLGSGSSLTLLGISTTTIVYAQAGILCPSIRIRDTAFIYLMPSVNLGADIVISSPQTVMLDAGPGFSSYLWSNGETTQTIVVNTTNNYTVTVTDVNGCTASDDIMVTVYVGIASVSTSSINIYPNPVHDILTVQLPSALAGEEKRLIITDVTGREVFHETLYGSGLHTLNVSSFARGVYILTLESVSGKRVVRVVMD